MSSFRGIDSKTHLCKKKSGILSNGCGWTLPLGEIKVTLKVFSWSLKWSSVLKLLALFAKTLSGDFDEIFEK